MNSIDEVMIGIISAEDVQKNWRFLELRKIAGDEGELVVPLGWELLAVPRHSQDIGFARPVVSNLVRATEDDMLRFWGWLENFTTRRGVRLEVGYSRSWVAKQAVSPCHRWPISIHFPIF